MVRLETQQPQPTQTNALSPGNLGGFQAMKRHFEHGKAVFLYIRRTFVLLPGNDNSFSKGKATD